MNTDILRVVEDDFSYPRPSAVNNPSPKNSTMTRLQKLLIYAVLVGAVAVFSLPLVVMVSGSLKSPTEIQTAPNQLIPHTWH